VDAKPENQPSADKSGTWGGLWAYKDSFKNIERRGSRDRLEQLLNKPTIE
jgi:hypothetical protein